MLFEISKDGETLKPLRPGAGESAWVPKELELEKFIISTATDEPGSSQLLNENIFGESLLYCGRQSKTLARKRADIVALDRAGNGVVIELKRDAAQLGVETQALQYLADFSRYKGSAFIENFLGKNEQGEEDVLGFLGGNILRDNINQNSRIILIARGFDETVFSMGEWLNSKGVAFRCIAYTPIEVGGKKLISFSVAFDRSTESLFRVSFGSSLRSSGYYWHNIGTSRKPALRSECIEWWRYLLSRNELSASFDNQPGDQGERTLRKYVQGDVIIAYAPGIGAVGYGVIKQSDGGYRLIPEGSSEDVFYGKGHHRHRLAIRWKAWTSNLDGGIRSEFIRSVFGIHHPISTSVAIDPDKARKLIKYLDDTLDSKKN